MKQPLTAFVRCAIDRRILFLGLILVVFPTTCWSWWIDKKKGVLVLEEGDSLWKVARSVYGAGWNYPLLWRGRLDSISTNPNLVYPGMRFSLTRANLHTSEPNEERRSLDDVISVQREIAKSVDHISKGIDSLQTLGVQVSQGVNQGLSDSVPSNVVSTLVAELIMALAAALSAKFGLDVYLKKKRFK